MLLESATRYRITKRSVAQFRKQLGMRAFEDDFGGESSEASCCGDGVIAIACGGVEAGGQ